MTLTVCLCANTLYYPEIGGHFWVYLNWALGLRDIGCEVIWLEGLRTGTPPCEAGQLVRCLKSRLDPYGLARGIALSP